MKLVSMTYLNPVSPHFDTLDLGNDERRYGKTYMMLNIKAFCMNSPFYVRPGNFFLQFIYLIVPSAI